MQLPIAVLVSGSGSNLQAIIDAAAADLDYGAAIVTVISDRPGARGLERAAEAGIPTRVVPWEQSTDRASFTTAVCDAAEEAGASALVLAGFMRILTKEAVDRFPNRILNIHPALIPSFPGAHGVRDALVHGVKVTGVTVHFVDEQVDHGPIIAQTPVRVLAGDTEESLHARIQIEEHKLFPEVVKAFAKGRLSIDGNTVVWEGEES
jgi:phosphoribosylglycinamide formyltransferase-1